MGWSENWMKLGMYLNWKKKIISVVFLKALGQEISGKYGALKMLRGSIVVMKGVWRNNLYYLKGNMVTAHSNDDCTRLWHMRLRHTSENSLQALAKKGLLKGAKTYKLKFCELCAISKKVRWKLSNTRLLKWVAERMNITLLGKIYCMLSNTGLSKSFWAEALAYPYHLINILPSSVIRGKFIRSLVRKGCSRLWLASDI